MIYSLENKKLNLLFFFNVFYTSLNNLRIYSVYLNELDLQ